MIAIIITQPGPFVQIDSSGKKEIVLFSPVIPGPPGATGEPGAAGAAGPPGVNGIGTLESVGALINSATAKTVPVGADKLGLMDSEDENLLKGFSWDSFWAVISGFFAPIQSPTLLGQTDNLQSFTPANGQVIEVNYLLGGVIYFDASGLGSGQGFTWTLINGLAVGKSIYVGLDINVGAAADLNINYPDGIVAPTLTASKLNSFTFKTDPRNPATKFNLCTGEAYT